MLKINKFNHNHQSSRVKILTKHIRRGNSVLLNITIKHPNFGDFRNKTKLLTTQLNGITPSENLEAKIDLINNYRILDIDLASEHPTERLQFFVEEDLAVEEANHA